MGIDWRILSKGEMWSDNSLYAWLRGKVTNYMSCFAPFSPSLFLLSWHNPFHMAPHNHSSRECVFKFPVSINKFNLANTHGVPLGALNQSCGHQVQGHCVPFAGERWVAHVLLPWEQSEQGGQYSLGKSEGLKWLGSLPLRPHSSAFRLACKSSKPLLLLPK